MRLEDITVEASDPNAILRSITVEDALRGLREAVAERGEDYVYQKPADVEAPQACLYVHGDEPGCLVGLALTKLGVPLEVLIGFDNSTHPGFTTTIVEVGWAIPSEARGVFGVAQRVQDIGRTWGEALKTAGNYARQFGV